MAERDLPEPGVTHKLHPSSLLFEIGKSFFSIVVVGLIVFFLASGDENEVWYMFFFVPVVIDSITRFVTYRYGFAEDHLITREGWIFKKTRHVPYDRIQNIDTVQGPLHRLFGVVEVRLETAGGTEPEAVMRVVSLADLGELRAGIFRGRAEALPGDPAERGGGASEEPFFRMRSGDVLLFGLFSQRGLVYLGGLFVLGWEFDLWERVASAVTRSWVAMDFLRNAPWLVGLGGGLLLGLLQLLTVAWAFLTLFDFKIVRRGDDLLTSCGLLTRQTATVPQDRIQFLSIREGLLHRLLGRASIKIQTAGGDSTKESQISRKWLVPLLERRRLDGILGEVQPEARPLDLSWHGIHERARGRMFRRWLFVFTLPILLFMRGQGLWALLGYLVALPLAWQLAVLRARRLGWGVSDRAVFLRDGRLAHVLSCVRFSKIQSVSLSQSPFDRHLRMAHLRVDTAGSESATTSFVIPYLAEDVARDLMQRLRREAGAVAFQW